MIVRILIWIDVKNMYWADAMKFQKPVRECAIIHILLLTFYKCNLHKKTDIGFFRLRVVYDENIKHAL